MVYLSAAVIWVYIGSLPLLAENGSLPVPQVTLFPAPIWRNTHADALDDISSRAQGDGVAARPRINGSRADGPRAGVPSHGNGRLDPATHPDHFSARCGRRAGVRWCDGRRRRAGKARTGPASSDCG